MNDFLVQHIAQTTWPTVTVGIERNPERAYVGWCMAAIAGLVFVLVLSELI